MHSPTFTLVNVYDGGRLKLFHLDLYRLETPAQILSAAVEEYLNPAGVTVIEWAERIKTVLPENVFFVNLEILSETDRRITHENPGD